jgi:guanine deaminase
VPHLQNF